MGAFEVQRGINSGEHQAGDIVPESAFTKEAAAALLGNGAIIRTDKKPSSRSTTGQESGGTQEPKSKKSGSKPKAKAKPKKVNPKGAAKK